MHAGKKAKKDDFQNDEADFNIANDQDENQDELVLDENDHSDNDDQEQPLDNQTNTDDTVEVVEKKEDDLVTIELEKIVELNGKFYRGVQTVTPEMAEALLEAEKNTVQNPIMPPPPVVQEPQANTEE